MIYGGFPEAEITSALGKAPAWRWLTLPQHPRLESAGIIRSPFLSAVGRAYNDKQSAVLFPCLGQSQSNMGRVESEVEAKLVRGNACFVFTIGPSFNHRVPISGACACERSVKHAAHSRRHGMECIMTIYQATPLGNAPPSSLSEAAKLAGLFGKPVKLHAGDELQVDGGTVWFPVDTVVRLEVGEPRALVGWIGRSGAVGLSEALSGPPKHASWVVEKGGDAYAVPRDLVWATLDSSTAFRNAVLVWLAQSGADARELTVHAVQCDAKNRVKRLLLDLHEVLDRPARLSISQAEIGRLTGIRRPTVCEVMVGLKELNLITYSRAEIIILDTTQLALAA